MTEKLSAFTIAGSPPALTDFVAGANAGSPNLRYTLAQIQSTTNVITINSTGILSGTSGSVLYDNAGTVGEASHFNIVSGQPNVPFGSAYFYGGSGFAAVDASNNVIIGTGAGNFGSVSGGNNLSIGNTAGFSLTSGGGNMLFGQAAGFLFTSGQQNVAIGHAALHLETTGNQNVAIGEQALSNQQGVSQNVAIGWRACQSNTSGSVLMAIGEQALLSNTTGIYNTGIGALALGAVTVNNHNTVIGAQGMQSMDASNNTGIGFNTGVDLTTGDTNTFIGYEGGRGITTGRANTFVGGAHGNTTTSNAIVLSDGDKNIGIDYNFTNAGFWTFAKPPIVPNFTVGTLPGGVTGALAYVTDGDSGLAWGATVVNSGSGATKYLVWFDGANWTVTGK